MKAQSQAGTTANVKFLVIAFKDVAAGKWRVLGPFDDLGDESAIDIDHQAGFFQRYFDGYGVQIVSGKLFELWALAIA